MLCLLVCFLVLLCVGWLFDVGLCWLVWVGA